MGDDESLPAVVKQILDSLKTYLCNNLPNEEAFIIQLGNAGLISKDKAPWLGVLARNKDPSCISNLIESMRDCFDESMLSNFCTFLDKYAKDARPQMRIVATKIRTKIGKANELKDPGSKRSQTPSVDHQPPPKKSHSAQEEPGGPGVSAGDEQAVRFAIIATTKTEWESAKFFMGLHMSKCDIKLKLKMHLIEKKLDDFKELYGREADDMSDGITRNIVGDHGTYTYIEVCGVRGVLTKCFKKGSHGLGAAGLTVADLLKISQDNKWDLEAVFIVGCCACASSAEKKVDLGAVLIANPIRQYSMKVTVENTALLLNKDDYFRIDPASKWLQLLEVPNDMPAVIEELKVRTLFSATFLSGDVMMNAGETFRENLNLPRLGFEMEGTGAHTAKQYYEIFSDKRQMPPAILVVKGVSDLADPDKNKSADTLFFKEKVNDFDEDSRQQMCTMMSLMIVFRAIKAKWPRGEKKKNPEAPS